LRQPANADGQGDWHASSKAKILENELEGKKILGKKMVIVLSYVFARDLFAFWCFSAQ